MRKLSQREALAMALNQWHHGTPAPTFGPSITRTAWILWAIVLSAIALGIVAGIVQLLPQVEEHCDHAPRAAAEVECAQRVDTQSAGQVGDIGHFASMPISPFAEYVHEVTP